MVNKYHNKQSHRLSFSDTLKLVMCWNALNKRAVKLKGGRTAVLKFRLFSKFFW